MKFCEFCNNMLYVSTDKDKKLINYCNMCGKKDVIETTSGSVCVVDDNKVNDDILFSKYINKYIKYDPSLPRVNNIECPNVNCTKKPDDEPETIYVKYHQNNMSYLYYCCHCEHFWRNKI